MWVGTHLFDVLKIISKTFIENCNYLPIMMYARTTTHNEYISFEETLVFECCKRWNKTNTYRIRHLIWLIMTNSVKGTSVYVYYDDSLSEASNIKIVGDRINFFLKFNFVILVRVDGFAGTNRRHKDLPEIFHLSN